jgi:ribosomal protein S18 acetylase RimI-like enzyme
LISTGNGVTFLPATSADIPDIVALMNAAYRGIGGDAGWTHEIGVVGGTRTDASTIAAMLATETGVILLMRDAADLTSLGCVWLEPTADTAVWYLAMLTVDPRRQAQGLGRRLLEGAEAYARAAGAQRITMTVVWLRDSLIAWYERRGYHRTGATEPFPYDDASVGTPLRDDLHFVVLDKNL